MTARLEWLRDRDEVLLNVSYTVLIRYSTFSAIFRTVGTFHSKLMSEPNEAKSGCENGSSSSVRGQISLLTLA